ncbi:MAG TPA: glutamate-5-semialdehyde dehydrogenase [bacterium]|jgi:glutamate-5-semialdehyde dehydrogenase|nr:glutamate-5-semialdehyde dehydrogenase [bacterium]
MNAGIAKDMEDAAAAAKAASTALRTAPRAQKDKALLAMAQGLRQGKGALLAANALDMDAAKASLAPAMLDRLRLDEKRIEAMAVGLEQVAALPDPVGAVLRREVRPNGLSLEKVRVPLGVVGIVYESRPNVTVDAAALCLKSGNACVLRGGSESVRSNVALGEVIRAGLAEAGLPREVVAVIATPDRDAVAALLKLNRFIDVIIPRGGNGLIRYVVENSSIPVIRHGLGNCHVYVDAAADLAMAAEIAYNAKVQRPSVCNAMEHLLVHEKVARAFLPVILDRYRKAGVELRGDEAVRAVDPAVAPASEEDWSLEYADLIAGVKVVPSLEAAIAHINRYGSQHSDAIVTADKAVAEKFLAEVDSAAVYWNASTRFTDGFEYGMGAEIGISTQKLHARGPMALEELCSAKWVGRGSGQVRA